MAEYEDYMARLSEQSKQGGVEGAVATIRLFTMPGTPLRELTVDSYFDAYRGAIVTVCEAALRAGDK